MQCVITIDVEVRDHETMDDILALLELQLPYIADNVMVCSERKDDD